MKLCISGLAVGESRLIDCTAISPTQLARAASNRMQQLIRKHVGGQRRYQFWVETTHIFGVRRLSDGAEHADAMRTEERNTRLNAQLLARLSNSKTELGE